LQDLFRRPIALLENKAIKNPYIRRNMDSVSDDVIWLIVNRYLPILEQEVKKLLK